MTNGTGDRFASSLDPSSPSRPAGAWGSSDDDDVVGGSAGSVAGRGASPSVSDAALREAVNDVIDFVDREGWGQPPQLFALVESSTLAAAGAWGGELAEDFGEAGGLVPAQQNPLPENLEGGTPELADFLSRTQWPTGVAGCVLVQEVPLASPDAPERTRRGRLYSAAVHEGPDLTVLQLAPQDDTGAGLDDAAGQPGTAEGNPSDPAAPSDPFATPDLRTGDLAPDIIEILRQTLDSPETEF